MVFTVNGAAGLDVQDVEASGSSCPVLAHKRLADGPGVVHTLPAPASSAACDRLCTSAGAMGCELIVPPHARKAPCPMTATSQR